MKPADEIMWQAQVFASAWSLVGGRFDNGNRLTEAEEAKAELLQMVAAAMKEREDDAFLPEGYTLHVIEALNENGDPVSVDAAEEIRRLLGLVTAHPKAQPMTREQIQEMLTAHFDDDTLAGDDMTLIRAVERHHKIGE